MFEANTVKSYMSTHVITLHPDMDVLEAVQILTQEKSRNHYAPSNYR
jgi:predicted transcriptional regulator